MALTGLHFLLTYQCTRECPHCFLFGSPRARGTFTLAEIEHLLAEGERLGSIDNVYFEGGEPFTHYPLLVAAVRAVRERGWNVGIVTNADWAVSESVALHKLKPLAELGLADLTISEDTLHGSGDRPAHARAAAERLGIGTGTITIAMGTCESAPGEPVSGGDVLHRGRAAETMAAGHQGQHWSTFDSCSHERLVGPGRVHIDAGGYVHLCQGLAMGNWRTTLLSDLVRGYDPQAHPVVGPLLAGGPAALARAFGLPEGETYADACHLCYGVRRVLRLQYPDLLGPGQVYGEIGVLH